MNTSSSPSLVHLGLLAALTLSTPFASAQQQANPVSNEELLKEVKALREEVQRLKEGPPSDPKAEELMAKPLSKGLSFAFYGEAKYRFPQDGANTFDPHRFVLAPSYQLADWLVMNSELEFEHGATDESANGGRNRFDGEIELEQFYVDILINDHFNIRSLGLDLVPVGRINKYHEPGLFYSTERPELYREVIPSTWSEPSVGFFGKIVEGWDYQLMISAGLEDAIPTAGSAATATRPAGLAEPGINAFDGFRSARPRYRRANANNLAYSGRVRYHGITGLDASTSFYITEVDGLTGRSTLALWDIEAVYRVPSTGLELRADFAYWDISNPEHLIANNNASTTDNVGDSIYGWYGEVAYHLWPQAWKEGRGSEMDFVPFVRYSQIVTQSGLGNGGVEADNGMADKEFLTAGVAYFLNNNFVIKADWRHNLQGSTVTRASAANQDYFQLGAGVMF